MGHYNGRSMRKLVVIIIFASAVAAAQNAPVAVDLLFSLGADEIDFLRGLLPHGK